MFWGALSSLVLPLIPTSSYVYADSGYRGLDRFKTRELSDAETYHLYRSHNYPCLQNLSFSRVFSDPSTRMKNWPKYFKNTKDSGEELRDGYTTLWTTFIIAVSLEQGYLLPASLPSLTY
jgi:hypothetical protein